MAADEVQRLDLKDLDAVLERAKAEVWTELAIVNLAKDSSFTDRYVAQLLQEGWDPANIFLGSLKEVSAALSELASLRRLNLYENSIGDHGAAIVAQLTELRSEPV